MIVLKDYQEWALAALREYFQECSRTGDANVSFYSVTKNTFGMNIPYNNVKELPDLPYVCLRIPTGGGKTIVACHSISIAAKELSHTEKPVVLWLVPSNAILDQTIAALRNRNHPYRHAIENSIGGFTVLDMEAALYVKRSQMDNETVIIISTMQSFRVEDTIGRRVYRDSGELMDHFSGLSPLVLDSLENGQGGNIIHSLANVLRIRRPIVIVDEAHNARTALSFETLARFHPSCIIEFTATPARDDHASNILYSASAADLKSAHMIKMPIRLHTRLDWKELLSDAIRCRNGLENKSNLEKLQTAEYIRPIMLIQAQPQRQGQETLTADVVKQCLITDYHIPEDQIAIATGSTKELVGIDIASPAVPIRYVITVQALREGWDCPFAYVLCSVAESRSATAIEQLLGRVMRLPGAVLKKHDELNMAFAFASSTSFSDVANTLTDALVLNGFEKQEAKELIVHAKIDQMELPLEENTPPKEMVFFSLSKKPLIEKLSEETLKKITYIESDQKICINSVLSDIERDEIKSCITTEAEKIKFDQVYYQLTQKSLGKGKRPPSERKIPFLVPALTIRQGDIFEQFEETHFLDHPWKLATCNFLLTEDEYSTLRPAGQMGEINISEDGKLAASFVTNLQTQMQLFAGDTNWTVPMLVSWIDCSIFHIDIPMEDMGIFLTNLILTLIDTRKFSLEQLVFDKYRLKKAIENKINRHRLESRNRIYQMLLFDEQAEVAVKPEIYFSFPPDPRKYAFSKAYKGRYVFKKHYYPEIGDLEEKGEEFECAQFIDQMDETDFWVRNTARRPGQSFWLQTSTDKFYPDFICKLKDERVLVVEYKGGHLWNDESKEKKALGELWAIRSNGFCLFVMPVNKDFHAIRKAVA